KREYDEVPGALRRPAAVPLSASSASPRRRNSLLPNGGKERRRMQTQKNKRRGIFPRGSRNASHAYGVQRELPSGPRRALAAAESSKQNRRKEQSDEGSEEQSEEKSDGDYEEESGAGEEERGDERDEEREDEGEDAEGEEEEGDGDDGKEAAEEEGGEDGSDCGDDSLFSSSAFSQMEGVLHTRLVRTLNHHGFRRLTAIQHLAIPTVLHGHDTLVQCFTGSGKTLCFVVPLLQQLLLEHERTGKSLKRSDGTRGLLLMPTRELAVQACTQISRLAQLFPWIVVAAVTGGEKKQSEKRRLRAGVTILLCTPGRVLDHLATTSCFEVSALHLLVLDEADRLLDLGFEAKLKKIVTMLAEKKAEQLEMKALRQQILEEQGRDARDAEAREGSDNESEASDEDSDAPAAPAGKKTRVDTTKRNPGFSDSADATSSEAAAAALSGRDGFQVIMASATLTPQVERLAAFCLRQEPQWVSLDRYHTPLLAHLAATNTEVPPLSRGSPRKAAESPQRRGLAVSSTERSFRFPCCCALSPAAPDSSSARAQGDEAAGEEPRFHVPSQLRQYYLQLSSPRMRLLPLLALLLQVAKTGNGKAIVFVSCCDAVEHFHTLLQRLRWPGPILDREQRQRQKERLAFLRRIQGGAARQALRRAARGLEEKKKRRKRELSGEEDAPTESESESDEEDEDEDEAGDELLGDHVLSGVSLFKLHGQMGRDDRLGYLKEFSEAPGAAVLFATDVAARGLNLPYVTWIAQFDLPQQVEEYVHRIGRTARLGKEGNALIFLLDCESGYAEYLQQRGFSSLQEMDESRMLETLFASHMPEYLRHLENPTSFLVKQFAAFVAERPSLLQTARRAFLGTLRALRCLGKEARAVCSHASLHTGHLATSFGLNETPREAAMRLKTGESPRPVPSGKGAAGGFGSRPGQKGLPGTAGRSSRPAPKDRKARKQVPQFGASSSLAGGRRDKEGRGGRAEDRAEIEVVPGTHVGSSGPKKAEKRDSLSTPKASDPDAARAAERLRVKGDLLRFAGKSGKREKASFASSSGARKRPRPDAAGEGAKARKKGRREELANGRKAGFSKPFSNKKGEAQRGTGNKAGGGVSHARRIRNLSQSEFAA
ncbi:putative ATP-dependent RNA helicase, partial [Neospora caninum Liverpool]